MTSAFSWQNSISLCSSSFCTPRPNLPVTPGVSWLPIFAFQSPIMKRTSFLGVSSKRSVGLHRTIQLQLLQRYWLGHRLGVPWCWMVCLGTNRDHCVVFEIASRYCILDSSVVLRDILRKQNEQRLKYSHSWPKCHVSAAGKSHILQNWTLTGLMRNIVLVQIAYNYITL